MSDDRHPIRTSVLGTVIATAVIALAVFVIPGGWAWVFEKGKKAIVVVYWWFGSSLPVPAWLVVVLSLIALVAIIAVAIVALAMVSKSGEGVESFTEAHFFGIKWRWRYGQNRVYCITSYCPKCDLQIYPRHASGYSHIDRIVYRCDDGHWESQEFEMSESQIENRIEREIHKEIRRKEEDAKRKTA